MLNSRIKLISERIAQNLAVATLLTGCVFGENQQFFSKLEPSTVSGVIPDPVSVSGGTTGGSSGGSTSGTTGSDSGSTGGSSGGSTGVAVGGTTGDSGSTGGSSSGGSSGTSGVPVVMQNDQFAVPVAAAPKIDVLFCVDNSGSMSDNQQILADSFSGFINGFMNAGLDFHVGIITSDVDSNNTSYWRTRLPDYQGANRGLLLTRYSSDRYLTQNTSGLVSKFEDNARVGIKGSGREQCLNSFLYAMEDSALRAGGWNHGFFREDSLLSFVVVSDENEDIQNGETIEARVARLKARVAAISGVASRGSRFDFIINKNYPAPATAPAAGQIQFYPERYLKAAQILNAQTFDIARNFSSDLLTISSGMVQQATREFTLAKRPAPVSSLVVKIDGQVIPADAVNGYIYHSDRNTVELVGSAAALLPGSELQVSYQI
jgi:hypothetical protein